MPYKKKNYKKKPRKGFYYHAHNVGDIATKALKVAYFTRKMLNVEYKLIENVINATAISNSGLAQDLPLLSQGTSNTNREGDQIKVTSIDLRYVMSMNASASDTTVRVILVLDKQPNGASIGLADILENTASPANIVSPLNLGSKYRIKILYNRVHQMSINGKQNAYGKKYIKYPFKVRYEGNAGTVADVTTNNLRLWFISDEATNTPVVESSCRLRFVDN